MFLYIEYQGTNPRVAPVTLHISIRKGIFGIRDLIKIRCGIQENAKYFDGKRDLTTTRAADSSKFRHRMRDFFLLVCREFEKSYVPAVTANQTGESSVAFPILSCLPLRFFWAFSLRFGILRYEWLFRFCNGLKTRVNSMYQSKERIYILHYFIRFCRN